jgi:hypothetical protein
MDNPIATIERHGCKAEIYEQALPGQFTILYRSAAGEVLEQAELTGVSTYRQREAEINDHLEQICSGLNPPPPPEALADSGEY